MLVWHSVVSLGKTLYPLLSTVQSLYYTPCYNMDLDITWSCCGSLFVCFVALRPKSTAMVMAGQSAHLTTLFPGQA